jgi:L-alanine-DL-glutamate epimerase-like enolase superfamily enzyme
MDGARVERVKVSCYRVPTATEQESDGTLEWDSTSVVVVHVSGAGQTGLGYTYCDPPAAGVIADKLAGVLEGADALAPQEAWGRMQVQARQLGHGGIAAMAISACDIALWDLKARLLGVCLADALPRWRENVAVYGSGGFCNYSSEQLEQQVGRWVEQGCESVKIKVGRDFEQDLERVRLVRESAGPQRDVMVDANGANSVRGALLAAERYAELGVCYFEEPVSSQDLRGMARVREHAPSGLSIAAGEYAWNLIDLQRMLDAGAVDILQGDVTRCGGITNLLRADALCKAAQVPFSAHCAPAVSAHGCCALETVIHIEYFFDHERIERILFDGTLDPHGGLLTPDRSRPGLGLELKRADAERYAI